MSSYQDDPSSTSATVPETGGTSPGSQQRTEIRALLQGLADYQANVAAWARAHPSDPFPAPVLHISLRGAPPEDRMAELHEIAAAFGVEVRCGEDGTKTVQQRFGAVVVKATYPGNSDDAGSDLQLAGQLGLAARERVDAGLLRLKHHGALDEPGQTGR